MLRTHHQSTVDSTSSFAVVCRSSAVSREDANGVKSFEKLRLGLALPGKGGEAEDARANRGPPCTTLHTLFTKLQTICFSKRLVQTCCSKKQCRRLFRQGASDFPVPQSSMSAPNSWIPQLIIQRFWYFILLWKIVNYVSIPTEHFIFMLLVPQNAKYMQS